MHNADQMKTTMRGHWRVTLEGYPTIVPATS
jgi:hypothetical protein